MWVPCRGRDLGTDDAGCVGKFKKISTCCHGWSLHAGGSEKQRHGIIRMVLSASEETKQDDGMESASGCSSS